MNLLTKHQTLLAEAARRNNPALDRLRLSMQLLSLTAAIDADCAARLQPMRLSEGKFVMLFLLDGKPDGLSPHELAEMAGVSRATVTGLLDGLQRDGYLSRTPDEIDRRKIGVRLSAMGQAAATELFVQHTAWISTLFDGLDQTDQASLARILQRVWQNTDAGRAAK